MTSSAADSVWETRAAALWDRLDDLPADEFLVRIDELTGELPVGSPIAAFERGAARDSTGHSDLAVPLYREALGAGLDGLRRRRAVIQMSSSLRNLGEAEEALALLTAERERGSDELDGALAVFLALVLADLGREREGLSIALLALAPELPRYNRSAANYARLLVSDDERS